jgi:hypothetical protein
MQMLPPIARRVPFRRAPAGTILEPVVQRKVAGVRGAVTVRDSGTCWRGATPVPFATINGLFIGGLLIFAYAACTLDGGHEICKLRFSPMATVPNPLDDPLRDFQFPQREAAFFYGLFLRGHTAEELRQDIAVPAAVLAKWDRETEREPTLRPLLERIVRYRQHVLAIFENLIGHDSEKQRLQ